MSYVPGRRARNCYSIATTTHCRGTDPLAPHPGIVNVSRQSSYLASECILNRSLGRHNSATACCCNGNNCERGTSGAQFLGSSEVAQVGTPHSRFTPIQPSSHAFQVAKVGAFQVAETG